MEARRDYTPDCLKEECGWWLHQGNCCSIPSIAVDLEAAKIELEEIAKKMPHEGQFRK